MWNGAREIHQRQTEVISHQQARANVTRTGWDFICRGYEWQSRCGQWMIYKAGHLYKRRRVR